MVENFSFHGWVGVFKPVGPTSFDMVAQVRRLLPKKTKVGHGGTLDPLAHGVLPIAIGEATKTVDYLMNERKEYIFDVRWGAERTTDDHEGQVLHESSKRPSLLEIQGVLSTFLGSFDQLPPLYSAKKIEGKRACDLARMGKEVTLKPSPVTIYGLEILDHTSDQTRFKAQCSKGTYIRSLARDMGRALVCYGHTASILRSQVGGMTLEDALPIEKLALLQKDGILGNAVKPIQAVLADIPAVLVTSDQEQALRYGQVVVCGTTLSHPFALCIGERQNPVGIVEVLEGQTLKPKRLFNV